MVDTAIENPVLGRAIAEERRSYVDPANFDEMSHVLIPVKACFAGVGIYEHHGCSLGRVAATRRMMQRLSSLWDVPVTVAVGTQHIPYNAADTMRFQGQTFTAYPQGGSRAWINRVLARERASR